ncbi:MAG: hypothetical protein VW378_05705 [bacterium]
MTKNHGGFLYAESIILLLLLAIIAIPTLKSMRQLINTSRELIVYDDLLAASHYVADYVSRWAESPHKSSSIDSYSDGDELEQVGDARINQLSFAETPNHFSDRFCTSITTWERSTRSDSAVILVKVWSDSNGDRLLDNNELFLSFSSIVTEK